MIYIITITFNDKDHLVRTLKSIRQYKQAFHKYVIIDGGSTDGTLALLQTEQDIVDEYISEPDKGLYDAMNKIHKISSLRDEDYVLWLNAGDELMPCSTELYNQICSHKCTFAPVVVKKDGACHGSLRIPKITFPINEKTFFPNNYFNHQGFFVNYKIIKNLYYKETVGLQADVLFMTECLARINSEDVLVTDIPSAVFYADGLSSYRHMELFKSYFAIASEIGYSLFKVILFHPYYCITQLLRAIMPQRLVKYIQSKKKRPQYINNHEKN